MLASLIGFLGDFDLAEEALAEKLRLLDAAPEAGMRETNGSAIADERLELIFTCCHPALATGPPARR